LQKQDDPSLQPGSFSFVLQSPISGWNDKSKCLCIKLTIWLPEMVISRAMGRSCQSKDVPAAFSPAAVSGVIRPEWRD
jgi:hypothetical protein